MLLIIKQLVVYECKDKQIRLTSQIFLGKSYPDLHSLSIV
uniref:Uncharacterized protein n=1 Tax=Podoviridae sp. ct5cR14 TaxID=2825220 RepID=A0A8S5PS61_9CAUD|nr:MAG TPA: hypothetical protein [Podoviridae sp. ct5cR14]